MRLRDFEPSQAIYLAVVANCEPSTIVAYFSGAVVQPPVHDRIRRACAELRIDHHHGKPRATWFPRPEYSQTTSPAEAGKETP